MSTVLSQIQTVNQTKTSSNEKSSMLSMLEQVYSNAIRGIKQKCHQGASIDMFHDYHQQVQKIVRSLSSNQSQGSSSIQSSRANSSTDDLASSKQLDSTKEQSQYMFLRNIWQSKYTPQKNYDTQDHIDRINKIVAMVRMRTNYMTKKESYLYEREQNNHQYLYENPIFMKLKEELEKVTMSNEQLLQKCHQQGQLISRLEREKSTLQQNFTNLKKKFQQMEKSWIQVSKKNICLEQDSLALKSQNSKSKLTSLRQSSDFNSYTGVDLKKSLSFGKIGQEMKEPLKQTQQPSRSDINQNSALLPIQNMFIDISLNLNSKKQPKQVKSNNRYSKLDFENEQNLCLNDVTQRINTGNNNTNQRLALCRSDRLITQASPLKFKNIRNQGSSARKTLLSSARSVDLGEKTSLNKPKFERTKPNYQHLLKSVGKDGCVINDLNIEKQSLLKKQNILTEQSSLIRTFKSSPRDLISRRDEVK